MAVLTQSQLKIGRSVARILKLFDWCVTFRLAAVIVTSKDEPEQTAQVKG